MKIKTFIIIIFVFVIFLIVRDKNITSCENSTYKLNEFVYDINNDVEGDINNNIEGYVNDDIEDNINNDIEKYINNTAEYDVNNVIKNNIKDNMEYNIERVKEKLQILALLNFESSDDIILINNNLINFSIIYNITYNREKAIIDDLYITKNALVETILTFFSIDKDTVEKELEKIDFVKYNDIYCYKIDSNIFEYHFNDIQTYINHTIISDDGLIVYSTSYIRFPDGQEFVFKNIKSLFSKDYKVIKYKEMELY